MFRIICVCLVLIFSFSSFYFQKSTASAASLEDVIGGVIGGVILNKQRKKEQQRQQRAYDAEQNRIRDAENVRLVAHFKRVQTALKSLGFYKSKIDGDFGSGSKAAYSKFVSAFNLPYVEPEFLIVHEIEELARAGWRSAKEQRIAEEGRFFERENYIKAKKAGFSDRVEWQQAREKGFSNKRAYAEFVSSGVASPEEYRANKNAILAKQKVAEDCLSNVEGEKWLQAERSCAFALVDAPNDLSISSSHQRAVREVDLIVERAFDERQAALNLIQPEEGSTEDAGSNQGVDIGNAQKVLKETNLLIAEVGLRRGVSNCEALISTEAFQETLDECGPIYAEHSDLAFSSSDITENQEKLAEILKQAELGVEENNKKTAAEQERLAFQEAQAEAKNLIENVSEYIGSGGAFEQPLAIAQAVANLKRAADGLNTQILVTNKIALSDLANADDAYVAFAQKRIEANQSAKTAALVQTRFNVEKMDAFVEGFVTKNLLDERVGDLLKLKRDLSEALKSGDEDEIKTANLMGSKALSSLGLAGQLSKYEYTPDGVTVSKEDVVASKSTIELEKSALTESTNSANAMLVDIKRFSDAKNKFQDPLAIATSVAKLRKALKANELADIELRVSELSAGLDNDTAYQSFTQSLNLASNASLANAASKAREKLVHSENFLVEYISNNITAENIDQFIEQKEAITATLSSGTDEGVVATENATMSFLSTQGLSGEYDGFVKTISQKNVSQDVKLAQNGLALNTVNAALLEGHPNDLILLRNTSPSAPNIGKNLVGDVTYSANKADICWAHATPQTDTSLRLTTSKLRSAGALNVTQQNCTADNFLNVDLVAIKRGDFLQSSVSLASVIVEAFEEGQLAEYLKTSNSQVAAFDARNGVDGETLANEILAGVKDGYGIVQISAKSNKLCVTSTDNQDTHVQLISDESELLNILLLGDFKVEAHSLEQAYILSQRGKCGAIYGSEADLKTVLTALEREKQSYSMVPKWFTQEEFSETNNYLTSVANATEQELAKKAQARQAQITLAKAKLDKEEADRFARQALLRDKHVRVAMKHLEPMGGSIREHILQGSKSQELSLFDKLKNKVTGLKQDLWKFNKVDYSLVDFGTANWQGREVTALVARFFYKSENAALGKHRTDCALVGYLIDEEFGQNRDPIHFACDQQSSVNNWLGSRKFSSLWNIQ